MTSYVENETQEQFDFEGMEELVTVLLEAVLSEEKCPYEAQVNLLVTDNEGIREYNRRFRRIDSPTDVLSFPNREFEKPGDFEIDENEEADYFDPDTGELILGDIIISVDKVKEQAHSYGHSARRELAFLTAHSMLHLCGYDHELPDEAAVMEEKQEKALAELGITRED